MFAPDYSRLAVPPGARLFRPIDDDRVRNQFQRYKQGGVAAPERMHEVGSEARLTRAEVAELDARLQQELHPSAAPVARWVKERFGEHQTDSGITALQRRLGYPDEKRKLLLGKAPAPGGAGSLRRGLPEAATITLFRGMIERF
jgi:hypothetical protein